MTATSVTATVLLTLAGPLQSWGRFSRLPALRDTADHPTYSGVIGLVGNALGVDYTDPVDVLTDLTFAVRADRSGQLLDDFHTSGGGAYPALPGDLANGKPLRASAAIDPTTWDTALARFVYGPPLDLTVDPDGATVAGGNADNPTVSTRRYLADAVFTMALTGDQALIDAIAAALLRPARPLFLGRRSCPPVGDVLAARTDHTDPVQALTEHPRHPTANTGPLTCWSTASPGDTRAVQVDDVPVGRFGDRTYRTRWEIRQSLQPPAHEPATELDFFTAGLRRQDTP